jgi:hypothetical protein
MQATRKAYGDAETVVGALDDAAEGIVQELPGIQSQFLVVAPSCLRTVVRPNAAMSFPRVLIKKGHGSFNRQLQRQIASSARKGEIENQYSDQCSPTIKGEVLSCRRKGNSLCQSLSPRNEAVA